MIYVESLLMCAELVELSEAVWDYHHCPSRTHRDELSFHAGLAEYRANQFDRTWAAEGYQAAACLAAAVLDGDEPDEDLLDALYDAIDDADADLEAEFPLVRAFEDLDEYEPEP